MLKANDDSNAGKITQTLTAVSCLLLWGLSLRSFNGFASFRFSVRYHDGVLCANTWPSSQIRKCCRILHNVFPRSCVWGREEEDARSRSRSRVAVCLSFASLSLRFCASTRRGGGTDLETRDRVTGSTLPPPCIRSRANEPDRFRHEQTGIRSNPHAHSKTCGQHKTQPSRASSTS